MTTHDPLPSTIGVILAGGPGKRLGGNKALREFAGTTLLERAIARLRPQCADLLISTNGASPPVSHLGPTVVTDQIAGQPGPLGGLLAALDALAARGDAEWLASAPVDCPFVPSDLVARLHATRGAAKIVVASSAGRTQPVVGLWHVSLRADLYHALAGEDLHKAGAFVARHEHAVAEWPPGAIDPFFNINTLDDLAEAERLAKAEGGAAQV